MKQTLFLTIAAVLAIGCGLPLSHPAGAIEVRLLLRAVPHATLLL